MLQGNASLQCYRATLSITVHTTAVICNLTVSPLALRLQSFPSYKRFGDGRQALEISMLIITMRQGKDQHAASARRLEQCDRHMQSSVISTTVFDASPLAHKFHPAFQTSGSTNNIPLHLLTTVMLALPNKWAQMVRDISLSKTSNQAFGKWQTNEQKVFHAQNTNQRRRLPLRQTSLPGAPPLLRSCRDFRPAAPLLYLSAECGASWRSSL